MAVRREEVGVPPYRGNANPLADADSNPYASPRQETIMALPEFAGGVYQMAGKWLVIHRTAALPQRCIKTGGEAQTHIKTTLYWHHPALLFLALLNPVIYLVVAVMVRRSREITLPLSRAAYRKYHVQIALGLFLLVAAFCCFLGAYRVGARSEVLAAILGVGIFPALLLCGAITLILAQLVKATKITQQFAVLSGICPEYLAELPLWPLRDGEIP